MPDASRPARPWKMIDVGAHPFLNKYALIIYAVVLVVLIPVIIIGNTLYVIRQYRHTLDVQLHTQAAMVGEVLSSHFTTREKLSDAQTIIDTIQERVSEISTIDILAPEGDAFRIIASTVAENINKLSEHPANKLAWIQNTGVANQSRPSESDIFRDPELQEESFWNVTIPIYDTSDEKIALVNLKLSLREVNKLEKKTLIRSYALLIMTLLIIIALTSLNTKFFEFAHLFKKLQEVDKMKDEFISMASHELRSPITAIKGFVSMFIQGSFGVINDAGTRGLHIIDASIKRLGDLVDDLLDVSRIEQNRIQLTTEDIDLNAVVQQTVDELKIMADSKNLQLLFTRELSAQTVRADRDKVRQILVNIIGNAIKYTKHGSVSVTIGADTQLAKIKVKDTGIGIPAKNREKLFNKFYRVESEATKGIVGTGLGLWITKQLITLMGGEIYVDSIEGTGTEVSFTLPISKKITT